MKNILALRQRKITVKADAATILAVVEKANGVFTPEQRTELDGLKKDLETVNADIANVEAFLAEEKTSASADVPNAAKKPWANDGEFLQAVQGFYASAGRKVDDRLYGHVADP